MLKIFVNRLRQSQRHMGVPIRHINMLTLTRIRLPILKIKLFNPHLQTVHLQRFLNLIHLAPQHKNNPDDRLIPKISKLELLRTCQQNTNHAEHRQYYEEIR